jgi:glycosyltransferase involved in cell wall biosynthesis
MQDADPSILTEPKGLSYVQKIAGLLSRIWRHPLTRGILRRLIPRSAREYYKAYRQGYLIFDKTRVVLYADPSIRPEYTVRQPPTLQRDHERSRLPVSLITTLNPAMEFQTWLDAICRQTRLPDEIVIADRGSADEKKAKIQVCLSFSTFPVRLVDADGKSDAEAINLAIQNATFPLIACTEMAGTPDANWLENLVAPLEFDPNVQLSAGFYQARHGSNFQRLCSYLLTPQEAYFQPSSFIPSWRSVAFRKDLWVTTDGYPEWPGDSAGEILFYSQARQKTGAWAVVPAASVGVGMPENLAEVFRFCFRSGLADGIIGFNAGRYWHNTLKLAATAFLVGFAFLVGIFSPIFFNPWGWIVPGGLLAVGTSLGFFYLVSLARKYPIAPRYSILFLSIRLISVLARMIGFADGVRKRPAARTRQIAHYQGQLQHILEQHPHCTGIILYPPTHDWGYMFQLPQQMARQFARMGYLYFYNTANEKTDDVTGFRQVEPNLFICNVPLETFQIIEQGSRDQPKPVPKKFILYIGSPWNRKYLPLFNNPLVIYDHYDDLAVSSGRVEDHEYLLKTADSVLVTSQRLLDNVKSLRPEAIFAPNGVDYEHFQALRPAPHEAAPADLLPILAKGKPIIGYTGALSERFDYDLYLHLIRSRPDYEFVLIGANIGGSLDRSSLLKNHLDNVSWLGMKSHDALIKYLWRFDVGIVPFKINKITLATTSIKIFEYMACQVPVVSVAMPESKRYSGVFIAETYEQFVEFLDTALRITTDKVYLATIDRVARANTWENRAGLIHRMIGKVLQAKSIGACDEQPAAKIA